MKNKRVWVIVDLWVDDTEDAVVSVHSTEDGANNDSLWDGLDEEGEERYMILDFKVK